MSSLGLSAFLIITSSGNGLGEEKLLPCTGPGLIPELSLHGPEEAGAGGMVSKRAEVKYICFLMCCCGNGSSCSPRHSKALLGEPNQTGCEEGGHTQMGAITLSRCSIETLLQLQQRAQKSQVCAW